MTEEELEKNHDEFTEAQELKYQKWLSWALESEKLAKSLDGAGVYEDALSESMDYLRAYLYRDGDAFSRSMYRLAVLEGTMAQAKELRMANLLKIVDMVGKDQLPEKYASEEVFSEIENYI